YGPPLPSTNLSITSASRSASLFAAMPLPLSRMIRLLPADLVAISSGGRYFYVVILSAIRLFGGNWSYVFHRASESPLATDEILGGPQEGFHAFVDFIWAKREDRITRLARKIDVSLYPSSGFLKGTNTHKGTAKLWFIYDLQ